MKALSAGLQSHLDSGATTLAWCWRITRTDGIKLGFTDHDNDLAFDGTTFEATSGFEGTAIESSVGLSVDNLDVESVLKSDRLNEDDLAAGLFDSAEIEIIRVNWQDTAQRVLMRFGNLGEVSRGQHAFTAEVRGLAHRLQQPQGRLYQFMCDADVGDGRCKVNLEQGQFEGSGSIASLSGDKTFVVSGLAGFANDWFTRGLLTWTGGTNAGFSAEVKLHTLLNATVTFELWQRPAQPLAMSDTFTVTAGCDKQFGTCRKRFGNAANFRGFPHIPGNDFAISYPNRDDRDNDGGRLVT